MAHRFGRLAAPFGVFSAFLYTIPSIALFQLLVPVTGITVTTIEIGLVGYTLLILFRNTLAGLRSVPPDVLEAARGMGLTRSQILRRVELPLALPAISAGDPHLRRHDDQPRDRRRVHHAVTVSASRSSTVCRSITGPSTWSPGSSRFVLHS